jgi:hypothetical protein
MESWLLQMETLEDQAETLQLCSPKVWIGLSRMLGRATTQALMLRVLESLARVAGMQRTFSNSLNLLLTVRSGLLAYEVASDPRISAVGIFNSGALNAGQQKLVPKFTKPVAYFIGGKSDIAWKNVSPLIVYDMIRADLKRLTRIGNCCPKSYQHGKARSKAGMVVHSASRLVVSTEKEARNGGDGSFVVISLQKLSLLVLVLWTWDGSLFRRIWKRHLFLLHFRVTDI